MTNTKISALPAASTPDGSEAVPVVQGGTTRRTTTGAITAAEAAARATADAAHASTADPHPGYMTGMELASAESRVLWSTTTAGSYVEVLPLTMSYVTTGRPAWDEISAVTWSCTSTGRCYVEIIDGTTAEQIANASADLTADVRQPMPRLAGRVPAGRTLRFYKVLVFQPAAGTLTLDVSGTSPIFHQARTI